MLLHEPSITKTAFHVGRDPETSQLNLEKAGVEVHQQTKKIVGNNSEQTTVPHIFAIGDVLQVFDRTQIMMEKLVPSVLHLPYDQGPGRGDTLGTRLIRQEHNLDVFLYPKFCQASATIDYRTYEIVAGIPLGYNYAHKPLAYTTS